MGSIGFAMKGAGRLLGPVLMASVIALTACSNGSSDGDAGGGPGLGSVVAGLTGALGAAATIAGVRAGNPNVAQQGVLVMQQAAELAARDAADQASSTPSDKGSAADLDAVATRCAARSERLYPAGPQNMSLMNAACTYHCAYDATGIERYRALYVESQRRANGLCSVSVSQTCNDINLSACRT
jgi:hypothetical protein